MKRVTPTTRTPKATNPEVGLEGEESSIWAKVNQLSAQVTSLECPSDLLQALL